MFPRPPGRPRLAENPESFRQEVLRLKAENGWGRGRIAAEMRVSELRVRTVSSGKLAESLLHTGVADHCAAT